MQVEVVKWGNSSAVRLPAAALKELNMALGDRLELKTEGGKIVLEPAQREYRLEDLLAGITKLNRHAPVDFGVPVGREAW
jgi:antitoxin MazE